MVETPGRPRLSGQVVHYTQDEAPLESAAVQDRLRAVAAGMASFAGNMDQLARVHHALNSGFNEPFAGFLYGLLITMFCNSFPGCPNKALYGSAGHTPLRVEQLQQQIQEARARQHALSEQLRARLAGRSDLFARPWATPGSARRVRVAVARDDTYADTPHKTPPNLNQEPRYMRGLFEKAQSGNVPRSRPEKQTRPETGRPGTQARPATRVEKPHSPALKGALVRSSRPDRFPSYARATSASRSAPAPRRGRPTPVNARAPFR